MTENNALAVSNQAGGMISPASIEQAMQRYEAVGQFIKRILHEGVDFGAVPGTEKKTLLKPGAEKMASFFGLTPVFEDAETIEDWTGANHGGEQLFYYRQKCRLYKGDNLIAAVDGSCNSWEKKYRYRWVSEFEIPAGMDKNMLQSRGGRTSEFSFAIEKAETTGKYGKPAEYWRNWNEAIESGKAVAIKRKTTKGTMMDAFEMDSTVYAVPNHDVAEQVNTILKMAQKRALVAAVLIATNTSEHFTQDIEDFDNGDYTEGTFTEVKPTAKTTKPPDPQFEQDFVYPNDLKEPTIIRVDAEAETDKNGKKFSAYTNLELVDARIKINAKLKDATLPQVDRDSLEYKRDCASAVLWYRQHDQ